MTKGKKHHVFLSIQGLKEGPTSTTNNRILIVDDEASIRRSLRATLMGAGFEIFESAKGEDALSLVRMSDFDAVLLDLNMPGIGGLETCRRMRRFAARIPILVMTVRETPDDMVEAFEAGVDDYLIKPFHVRELIARLLASICRAQRAENEKTVPVITIGDIELDSEHRSLLKGGRHIHLTPKEFDLLRFLMSNAGKPVSHERLLGTVWGIEYRSELEYLRTFMHQLRKKIEDNPCRPKYLLTEAHIGYRFAEKIEN